MLKIDKKNQALKYFFIEKFNRNIFLAFLFINSYLLYQIRNPFQSRNI